MISAKFYPRSSHDGIATEDVCKRDGPLWCHSSRLALQLRLSLTARRKAQLLSLRKELCLLASQAYDVQDVVQLSILLQPWKVWIKDVSPPAWDGTVYSINQKNVNTEEVPRPPDPCWPCWRRTPQTYTSSKSTQRSVGYTTRRLLVMHRQGCGRGDGIAVVMRVHIISRVDARTTFVLRRLADSW